MSIDKKIKKLGADIKKALDSMDDNVFGKGTQRPKDPLTDLLLGSKRKRKQK